MNKGKVKMITVMLAVCAMLLMCTVAFAAEYTYGGLIVTSEGTPGADFEYKSGEGCVYVYTDTAISFRNADSETAITTYIRTKTSGVANITLAGVNIKRDGYAVFTENAQSCTVTLADNTVNRLESTNFYHAALHNGTTPLVIDGNGTLYATGSDAANAAIGNGNNSSAANITIKSGTIYASATGGGGAAAIGAGEWGNAWNIKIEGGYVEATTEGGGAGIGGGQRYRGGQRGGEAKNIEITGGTVIAKSAGGAAIGGGGGGSGSNAPKVENITIGGTANVTATGVDGGAGIGGGAGSVVNNIVIKDQAKVKITASRGAGIGGGRIDYVPSRSHIQASNVQGVTIQDDAEVEITTTNGGAGIGGGDGTYDTEDSKMITGGYGKEITIKDRAKVTITANDGGAGIGGGRYSGEGSDITIEGDAQVSITTTGGGAGIGGGSYVGKGSDITIDGNAQVKITAEGGGAAIGGGRNGFGTDITINNGNTTATTKGSATEAAECGDTLGNGYLGTGDSAITVSGGTLELTATATTAKVASRAIQFTGDAVASFGTTRAGRDTYDSTLNDEYNWLLYPYSMDPPGDDDAPPTGDSETPWTWMIIGCISLMGIALLVRRRVKHS